MVENTAVDILLVEDNPQDLELTIRALKKRNLSNRVVVARDGAEALDILFKPGSWKDDVNPIRPRVILLDLKLPKVSGLEVLAEIRKSPIYTTTPVVVVTSSAEEPDIKEAYRLGANSYIVKPVNFEKFAEAMGTLGFYWLLINQPPV